MKHIHINDRSDLDAVIAYNPAKRQNITRRDMLARPEMPRSDVVLAFGRFHTQYALYVCYEGFAGDVWLLDILTDAQYDEVQRIATKMRANCADYAPAWKLMGHPSGSTKVTGQRV